MSLSWLGIAWFVSAPCFKTHFLTRCLCLQNLIKENLKNKQQRVGAEKTGSAHDVAKVTPKTNKRGEGPCRSVWWHLRWMLNVHRELAFLFHIEQLMKKEEKCSAEVSWSVYGAYIRAAGGPAVFIINIVLFLSTTGGIAFSNWWLSHWIKQGSGVSLERNLLCSNLYFCSWKKITTILQGFVDRWLKTNLND